MIVKERTKKDRPQQLWLANSQQTQLYTHLAVVIVLPFCCRRQAERNSGLADTAWDDTSCKNYMILPSATYSVVVSLLHHPLYCPITHCAIFGTFPPNHYFVIMRCVSVGMFSPKGGTRLPFYLVGDVGTSLRTTRPRGRPFLRPRAEAAYPLPHSVTVFAIWHMGGS